MNLISSFKLMALSELYKIIPSEPPPILFPFPIKKRLNDSYQYTYKQFLYPEKKLKIGRAIKINEPIVLIKILKPITKRTQNRHRRSSTRWSIR